MMTDPRFGRLQEGFGENPIIASHMGRASVLALQGGPGNASTYLPEGHVCSLGKHFGAYGAAIGGLNGGPADISNRTLHEVYLRPWMALGRAGVRAVMPSHNAVGDVPCHANHWMLQQKLRDEFGFGGVALSDCDDVGEVYSFGMAPNRTAAAALSLNAGVDWDLQCGTDPEKWSYNKLDAAIDAGLTTEAALDKVVRRVLRQKFAAGLFDGRSFVPYDNITLLDCPAHRQLALEGPFASPKVVARYHACCQPSYIFGAVCSRCRAKRRPLAEQECYAADDVERIDGGAVRGHCISAYCTACVHSCMRSWFLLVSLDVQLSVFLSTGAGIVMPDLLIISCIVSLCPRRLRLQITPMVKRMRSQTKMQLPL